MGGDHYCPPSMSRQWEEKSCGSVQIKGFLTCYSNPAYHCCFAFLFLHKHTNWASIIFVCFTYRDQVVISFLVMNQSDFHISCNAVVVERNNSLPIT